MLSSIFLNEQIDWMDIILIMDVLFNYLYLVDAWLIYVGYWLLLVVIVVFVALVLYIVVCSILVIVVFRFNVIILIIVSLILIIIHIIT
jgi:hypothetical protein